MITPLSLSISNLKISSNREHTAVTKPSPAITIKAIKKL